MIKLDSNGNVPIGVECPCNQDTGGIIMSTPSSVGTGGSLITMSSSIGYGVRNVSSGGTALLCGKLCNIFVNIDITNKPQLIANITGGTSPYYFLWNTGDTTSLITITDTGTYWVQVTDANGCLSVDTAVINSFPLSADLVSKEYNNRRLCSYTKLGNLAWELKCETIIKTVKIHSVEGKLIKTIKHNTSKTLTLGASNIQPGVYLLNIETDAGIEIIRLVN